MFKKFLCYSDLSLYITSFITGIMFYLIKSHLQSSNKQTYIPKLGSKLPPTQKIFWNTYHVLSYISVFSVVLFKLAVCVPGSGRPVASVDQQCPGWAVEHHGVASSGRGLPTSGLDSFPPSWATQAEPIQRRGKHILLSATWEIRSEKRERCCLSTIYFSRDKLMPISTQTAKGHYNVKLTSKYIEMIVYYGCSMIGQFRSTMWIWKAELLPVILDWPVHPHITGQGAIG